MAVALVLVVSFLSACGSSPTPSRTVYLKPPATRAQPPEVDAPENEVITSAFSSGDEVDVEYGGQWYPATVLSVARADVWEISYDGYGPEWNERVGEARIRERVPETPPGFQVASTGQLPKDTAVLVQWNSSWYPAHVRAVTPGGEVRIGYDGYDAQWDETVDLGRVRLYRDQPNALPSRG